MPELPQIRELTITAYLKELSSDSLFPSAGASAGLTAAQAAALFGMVCQVNLRKLEELGITASDEGYREIVWNKKSADGVELRSYWEKTFGEAMRECRRSLDLAQADGEAYLTYVAGDPRGGANSIDIPLEIARSAVRTVGLIETSYRKSYPPVRADAETARCLLRGAHQAALAVARYNLPLLTNGGERQDYVNLIREMERLTPGAQLMLPV